MNKQYTFYYDETYHDRKITYKDDINIENEKTNAEFFLGCFLGSDKWEQIEKEVSILEKSFKQKYGFQKGAELKSNTLLKQKFLSNGISSLPKYSVEFYSKLFEILNNKIDIHLIFLNKYEEIIRKAMPKAEWFDNKGYVYKVFVYSLTKFISIHRYKYNFIDILYSKETSKAKKKQIIEILIKHKNSIKNISKKQDEVRLMDEFIKIFSNKTFYFKKISKKIVWNYDEISLSFLNYCISKNINVENLNIIIDSEEKTLKSIKKFIPVSVECNDSKESLPIRICDWVVGFVGKIVLSYSNQTKNVEDIEFTEKLTLLSEDCFVFSEVQKRLISQIYNLFLVQQENYWATTTSNYSDYTMIFYTFIRYCEKENGELNANDFNTWLHNEFVVSCSNLYL